MRSITWLLVALLACAAGRSGLAQTTPALLTPADFTYQGFYDVQLNEQDSTYGQGLTHRYVDGDLRLMSLTGGRQRWGWLDEFSLKEQSYGARITTRTNSWNVAKTGVLSDHNGIWFEQAKNRLWVSSSRDYTNEEHPVRISVMTLGADGQVTNVHTVGLRGLNAKRVYGGCQGVPAWFQTMYKVGPYVCGWGGYTSLMAQGGGASLGPTMYSLPEPTSVPSGTALPSRAYKVIMDYAAGDERGRRLTIPQNYFDGGDPRPNPPTRPTAPPVRHADWLSPDRDGFGRFVWGDSYYNTGAWIDTPTRRGFVLVASLCGGACWYQSSTLEFDRRVFELHVFDPAALGASAAGKRRPWQVVPANMTELTWPRGNNERWNGNVPVGNIGGATFDATSGRLYALGLALGADVFTSRVYVVDVAK